MSWIKIISLKIFFQRFDSTYVKFEMLKRINKESLRKIIFLQKYLR